MADASAHGRVELLQCGDDLTRDVGGAMNRTGRLRCAAGDHPALARSAIRHPISAAADGRVDERSAKQIRMFVSEGEREVGAVGDAAEKYLGPVRGRALGALGPWHD